MHVLPVIGIFLIYSEILIIHFKSSRYMWYDKEARTIAGKQYVKETTRWIGHTHVVNLPVSYE